MKLSGELKKLLIKLCFDLKIVIPSKQRTHYAKNNSPSLFICIICFL